MNDSLLFSHNPINTVVSVEGSKSISIRALIISAMCNGMSRISNLAQNDDVQSCINVLRTLGIEYVIDRKKKTIDIYGCQGRFPIKKANLFCNESGLLTRIMIPLCAAQSRGVYCISGHSNMINRPIYEQIKILNNFGLKIKYLQKDKKLPISIYSRGIYNKEAEIEGRISSQFLSGILISAPFFYRPLTIISKVSHIQPYILMTKNIMKEFSVNVKTNNFNQYYVDNKQKYFATDYFIEPDVSTASYFWALAIITRGKVKVRDINLNSQQGDIEFLRIIEKMGGQVFEDKSGITVSGNRVIKGIKLNMRSCSDVFMTIAVIACFANSPTHISGLSHTKFQESKRVQAIGSELKKVGIKVFYTEDSISIYPQEKKINSVVLNSHNDHRIAMSLALLGLKIPNIKIRGGSCVKKTCPNYFKIMNEIIYISNNDKNILL